MPVRSTGGIVSLNDDGGILVGLELFGASEMGAFELGTGCDTGGVSPIADGTPGAFGMCGSSSSSSLSDAVTSLPELGSGGFGRSDSGCSVNRFGRGGGSGRRRPAPGPGGGFDPRVDGGGGREENCAGRDEIGGFDGRERGGGGFEGFDPAGGGFDGLDRGGGFDGLDFGSGGL